MKIDYSYDVMASSPIPSILREARPIYEDILYRYPSVNIEIFYVFRSLLKEAGQKTRRRLDRRENVLFIDLIFDRNFMDCLSVAEQRHEIGGKFYTYTMDSLEKYKFNNLDLDDFSAYLINALKEIDWIK